MKIQLTDKVNIQLNSEYPNIIMIMGKSLIITLKYKTKVFKIAITTIIC